ncbi:TetR/AcrR family transcriptional regulator [Paenibacillus whitsoniae]|uniref:TetR/AcrR family transcriptional regulator n=1 Tax=Paenibacillus whitsoniae TaxID=2496558 RepID=A0A430JFZ0_9BACL|nr:TetR/AcrR family transcriptional regulator [Paenibacillus whitsoniae]RTE09930.1 TetR/AcrR family transcriptional regulator [Paenibacillus whitsoniae]
MQILKDEVKRSICTAALAEFKQHGFLKASMRQIAEAAGMTPGNIYRYFKSKEDLFGELLQPVYEELTMAMGTIKQEIDGSLCVEVKDHLSFLRQIDATLIRLFRESSTELNILLNLSEGSEYRAVKGDLVTLVNQIMLDVYGTMSEVPGMLSPREQASARMVASTIMESICLILRENEDGDMIKMLVDELLFMYSVGIGEKMRLRHT